MLKRNILLILAITILSVIPSYKAEAKIYDQYSYEHSTRCRDGSYSSAHGQGACSHHGGVS